VVRRIVRRGATLLSQEIVVQGMAQILNDFLYSFVVGAAVAMVAIPLLQLGDLADLVYALMK
jgi:hypothetical protein